MSQTKLRTTKSPHTRTPPPRRTRASHVLRALAPTKPNSERENGQQAKERENPRKQNLRMQKSPPTRATPPRRTRAPGTCCVRLLRESRTQNGKMDSKQKNGTIPANKISERKNPHTRAQSPPRRTRAPGTCCVRLLRESRTQNGKMDSKQKNGTIPANKISERKNPHTRAQSPPRRTRAPGTCCVRLLRESRTQNGENGQQAKERENPRKPNLERQNPPIRAQSPSRRTRASHMLRALAPRKPNLERENGQQAPFSVNCSTISKKWSKRCQHPWKTIFLLAAENRLPRCARMSRTSSRSQL